MEKIRLEVGRPWVAPKLKKVDVELITAARGCSYDHQKVNRGWDGGGGCFQTS
jgi:hypothetical protein